MKPVIVRKKDKPTRVFRPVQILAWLEHAHDKAAEHIGWQVEEQSAAITTSIRGDAKVVFCNKTMQPRCGILDAFAAEYPTQANSE